MPALLSPDYMDRLVELAMSIQQISAPSLEEEARAKYVKERFEAEKLLDVEVDAAGNVYGRLAGGEQLLPLIISAHLDTVFPPGTDLTLRRDGEKIYGPGIGDNSMGVAGLFGLLWLIREQYQTLYSTENTGKLPLPWDIWFVANTGEEGIGNLKGMRAVVERFGSQVSAYLVLEGMALGQVYHRALGVQRYRIAVETMGGHSWADYGRPSAIHELAELITSLTKIKLPEQPRTTMNVGVIEGGFSVNTIAAYAHLDLDLRSEDAVVLKQLAQQVEDLVKEANRPDVQVSFQITGNRPAGQLPVQHPIVQLAKRCVQDQGIEPNLGIGSTDANIPLSQGLPAVCLGITTGSGAHTLNECIDTTSLKKGILQLAQFVDGLIFEYTRDQN